MSKNIKIRKLNNAGFRRFVEICTSPDLSINFNPIEDSGFLSDSTFTTVIDGLDSSISCGRYKTAKDLAEHICKKLKISDFYQYQNDYLLWGWLTLAMWENLQSLKPTEHDEKYLFKPYKLEKGKYVLREKWVFVPAEPKDFYKYQRHILRTPCELFSRFGSDADHLLAQKPNVRGDVLEQLTSRHTFWDKLFVKVGNMLYWDSKKRIYKKGATGKGRGSPRRLRRAYRQFDVTWQIDKTDASSFVKRLPKEFDLFK